MSINSPKQLKDWLRNKEKKDGIPANTLINYYMLLGSRLRRNKNNQCPRLVTGKIAYLTRFVTSIRTVFKQLA